MPRCNDKRDVTMISLSEHRLRFTVKPETWVTMSILNLQVKTGFQPDRARLKTSNLTFGSEVRHQVI